MLSYLKVREHVPNLGLLRVPVRETTTAAMKKKKTFYTYAVIISMVS